MMGYRFWTIHPPAVAAVHGRDPAAQRSAAGWGLPPLRVGTAAENSRGDTTLVLESHPSGDTQAALPLHRRPLPNARACGYALGSLRRKNAVLY